jgi:hypothetical protein
LLEFLKRIRRLKEGGVEAYKEHSEIKTLLEALIEACSAFGLFFVPVGELEDWVPDLMSAHPKSGSKTERAAIAATKIREAARKEGDVWQFIENVYKFLDER